MIPTFPPKPMGAMAPAQHPGRWSQDLCACNPIGDCLYAFLCPQCAHATAREAHDGSSCCLHFLFSPPWLTINVLRTNYGIGTYQDCCDDIVAGLFCAPCGIRRALVEGKAYSLQNVGTSGTGAPQIFAPGVYRGLTGLGSHRFGSGEKTMWLGGGLGDCWGGVCSHTFCYALLFPMCASARARQYLDGSDCCFNVFAVTPCEIYHMTRHYHGIHGEWVIDCCTASFCYACAIDRAYREILLNAASPVLRGCCNSCCGGVPIQRASHQPQQQQMQGQKKKSGCC